MNAVGLRFITFAAVSAAVAQDSTAPMPVKYPYSAALISTMGSLPGRTDLLVFPSQGKAFRIPIRSASGPFAYSPDGRALFGQCTPQPTGEIALCRIDLETNRITPVPGSTGLYAAHLAISAREDHIIVAGLHRRNGDIRGLFDLDLKHGTIRMILAQSDPGVKSSWAHISLSPDGERATAIHNDRLELININRRTAEPWKPTLFMASWSADGRWVAALERGEKGNTILMDAKHLKQERVLGPSELDWSPDSRFLLGLKANGSCGPDLATLEAINIESGERKTITSSECQVNQATTGWVRVAVRPNAEH